MKLFSIIISCLFFSNFAIAMNDESCVQGGVNCKDIRKILIQGNVRKNLFNVLNIDKSFQCPGCKFHDYPWFLYLAYGRYFKEIVYCLQNEKISDENVFNFLVATFLMRDEESSAVKKICSMIEKNIGKEQFCSIIRNAQSYYSLLSLNKYKAFNKNLFSDISHPLVVVDPNNKGDIFDVKSFADYVLAGRTKPVLSIIGNEVDGCFDFIKEFLPNDNALMRIFKRLIPLRFNELMLSNNNEIRLDMPKEKIEKIIETDYFLKNMVEFIRYYSEEDYSVSNVMVLPDDFIESFDVKNEKQIKLWKKFMQKFTPQLFCVVADIAKNHVSSLSEEYSKLSVEHQCVFLNKYNLYKKFC